MKNTKSIASLLGMAALLAALPGLFACQAQEQPAAEPAAAAKPAATPPPAKEEPSVARFEGELGHFEKGKAFEKFIFDHTMKPVYIDAYMTPGPMDDEKDFAITNDTFGLEYFVLWDTCESLKPGEKPAVGACMGTEFSIDRSEGPKDSDLTFIRGVLHLKGYFVVKGCDGPHQGLMGCSLRPVNVESVM